jgi:hypothetical protein
MNATPSPRVLPDPARPETVKGATCAVVEVPAEGRVLRANGIPVRLSGRSSRGAVSVPEPFTVHEFVMALRAAIEGD